MLCISRTIGVLGWTLMNLLPVFGQEMEPYYQFESRQAAYQPLDAPTVLNPGIDHPGHDHYTVSLPFTLHFFGQPLPSLRIQRNGLIFGAAAGEFIAPFRPSLAINPQAQVSYQIQTEGPCQQRIVKLEWKNLALRCEADSLVGSVSFQVWLYENSHRIELHYGPQQVQAAESCQPDRYTFNGPRLRLSSTGQLAVVVGSYEQPALVQDAETLSARQAEWQRGIPPAGTVYRFTPVHIAQGAAFRAGPIPAQGTLYVQPSSLDCRPYRLTLADLWGRVYLWAESQAASLPLDLRGFQPGWYLLRLDFQDGSNSQTFKFYLQGE